MIEKIDKMWLKKRKEMRVGEMLQGQLFPVMEKKEATYMELERQRPRDARVRAGRNSRLESNEYH